MPNVTGSENVSSTVPEKLARDIEGLARESGLSRSRYVGILLNEAAERRRVFRVQVTESLREDATPYKVNEPKLRK